jgi:hypothetical protein
LQLTLEGLFKHSDAFKTALELYAGRDYISYGNLVITSPELGKILADLKAQKLDNSFNALSGLNAAKGIFPKRQPQPQPDWMTRLGKTIAELFEDESLSGNTYAELSDCMLEISNSVNIQNIDSLEAELMLPHYLRYFWASEDEAKLVIRYGTIKPDDAHVNYGATRTLYTVQGSDICTAFEEVVRDFDRIFAQTEEEDKATRGADNCYAIQVCLQRKSGNFLKLHQCLIPLDWFSRLEDYLRQHAPPASEAPAPEDTGFTPAYRLGEYEELSLSFNADPEGDDLFSFQFFRRVNDSEEIQISTYGANPTSLYRNGYSIPIRDTNRGKLTETITLRNNGRMDFLGRKDKRVFSLLWTTTNGQLEAEILMYGEKDAVVQNLSILE